MRPLLQIALKLRHFYWWLVRPITRGVRAIVANGMGRVLLVRHNYGEGWLLPGGAVRKNEDCETALRRELEEELGITDISIVNRLGEYRNTYEYKIDTIVVFAVGSFALEKKRHFEIEGWDFLIPAHCRREFLPGRVGGSKNGSDKKIQATSGNQGECLADIMRSIRLK